MSILKKRKKTYNKIVSFGCSITYGDGLDNLEYHKFINSGIFGPSRLTQYREDKCYGNILSNMLFCQYENYAEKNNNNDNIFKQTYNYCKDMSEYDKLKTLVIVQTTFCNRKAYYDVNDNREYWLNSHYLDDPHVPIYLKNHFSDFLIHFYDLDREFKNLNMQAHLVKTWLTHNQIDSIFVGYDEYDILPYDIYYHFPETRTGAMQELVNRYRLLISHVEGIPFKDHHLTEHGHEIIATMLKHQIE